MCESVNTFFSILIFFFFCSLPSPPPCHGLTAVLELKTGKSRQNSCSDGTNGRVVHHAAPRVHQLRVEDTGWVIKITRLKNNQRLIKVVIFFIYFFYQSSRQGTNSLRCCSTADVLLTVCHFYFRELFNREHTNGHVKFTVRK